MPACLPEYLAYALLTYAVLPIHPEQVYEVEQAYYQYKQVCGPQNTVHETVACAVQCFVLVFDSALCLVSVIHLCPTFKAVVVIGKTVLVGTGIFNTTFFQFINIEPLVNTHPDTLFPIQFFGIGQYDVRIKDSLE